jgi:hypothetical protein
MVGREEGGIAKTGKGENAKTALIRGVSSLDKRPVNPYASPQVVENRPAAKAWIFGSLGRLAILIAAGYLSFASFGLLYWLVSDENTGQASVPWALGVGLIGAFLFAVSEVLNAGPGAAAGSTRRVIVTLILLVPSLVFSGSLTDALGWSHRGYEPDPRADHKAIITGVVFILALILVRLAWPAARKMPGI